MRLVTYRRSVNEEARLGALVDNLVVDLQWLGDASGMDLPDNMLDFIDLGPEAIKSTTELLNTYRDEWPVGVAIPVQNVKLLAPIPQPRKNIFGIGLNYTEHVAESAKPAKTARHFFEAPNHCGRQWRRDRAQRQDYPANGLGMRAGCHYRHSG